MIYKRTTDVTHGSGLRARVESRQDQLELELESLPLGHPARPEIEHALDEVHGLLAVGWASTTYRIWSLLHVWLDANEHVNDEHPSTATRGRLARLRALRAGR